MYFLIELITLCLSIIIVLKFGLSDKTIPALILTWVLIAASGIDYKHYILPDNLTMPTLWLGLIFNLNNTFISIHLAVISAVIGYSLFWLIAKAYLLTTKTEGIGYGDFKLYALFGAWIGVFMLPQMIIISSILALIIAVISKLASGRSLMKNHIPYGPFIAIAGYIALIYGDKINNWYLDSFVF